MYIVQEYTVDILVYALVLFRHNKYEIALCSLLSIFPCVALKVTHSQPFCAQNSVLLKALRSQTVLFSIRS